MYLYNVSLLVFLCILHRMIVLHWLDFHDIFEFMFTFLDNAGIIYE